MACFSRILKDRIRILKLRIFIKEKFLIFVYPCLHGLIRMNEFKHLRWRDKRTVVRGGGGCDEINQPGWRRLISSQIRTFWRLMPSSPSNFFQIKKTKMLKKRAGTVYLHLSNNQNFFSSVFQNFDSVWEILKYIFVTCLKNFVTQNQPVLYLPTEYHV
jgi:hypothetical protein